MRKVPTAFIRMGRTPLVSEEWHADCLWVRDGEGVATRKLDGQCVTVIEGELWKRREFKPWKESLPLHFVEAAFDPLTGAKFGWVPVGAGPEDRWLRECFASGQWMDGTYEAVGPMIQGNAENLPAHTLIRHADPKLILSPDPGRLFEEIHRFFRLLNYEGIVWHHPDGRMAKIKGRDFGIKRP